MTEPLGVVVVATEDDLTADLVVGRLGDRARVVRLDPGRLDGPVDVSGHLGAHGWETTVRCGRRSLRLGPGGCAVLWRKPTRPETLTGDQRWRADENTTALTGLLRTAPVRVWCNDPTVVEAVRPKAMQLAAARAAGFDVPDTLLTSDPARARAFVDAHPEGVVVKALTQRHTDFIPTTLLRGDDALAGVAGCVHQFQALVPKSADARVIVVGDRVFAAEVTTDDALLDWRAAPRERTRHRPITPPPGVERRCREHVRALGLTYGALDFALDGERWAYLECNPAGEWGYIEALTGHPISEAVADLLTAPRPKEPPS